MNSPRSRVTLGDPPCLGCWPLIKINSLHNNIVIVICHTLFTMIPFFWPQYNYNEVDIWEKESPIKIESNKYAFGFITIYIIWFFTFICLQRLILLKQKELKAWYYFLKLLFCIISINFIWGNFILNISLKFGIPNWLLAANIIWNIIKYKNLNKKRSWFGNVNENK